MLGGFVYLFVESSTSSSEYNKGAHLHRMLRPELIQSNSIPLSSDAYSAMGTDNMEVHNQEILQATKRLYFQVKRKQKQTQNTKHKNKPIRVPLRFVFVIDFFIFIFLKFIFLHTKIPANM